MLQEFTKTYLREVAGNIYEADTQKLILRWIELYANYVEN